MEKLFSTYEQRNSPTYRLSTSSPWTTADLIKHLVFRLDRFVSSDVFAKKQFLLSKLNYIQKIEWFGL